MPTVDLNVNGSIYSFISDTGATMSSLGSTYEGPVSGQTISSVGIDGVPFQSHLTPPFLVFCADDPDTRLRHRFVFMEGSPFNLLGRDLMSKLCLSLCFSGSKITVNSYATEK